MKHCGECGSSINTSAKYCNQCGKKLSENLEIKKVSNKSSKNTNITPIITIIFSLLAAYEFLYFFAEESGLAFVLMIAFSTNAFLAYKVESGS